MAITAQGFSTVFQSAGNVIAQIIGATKGTVVTTPSVRRISDEVSDNGIGIGMNVSTLVIIGIGVFLLFKFMR
jgi:hypothetical protein